MGSYAEIVISVERLRVVTLQGDISHALIARKAEAEITTHILEGEVLAILALGNHKVAQPIVATLAIGLCARCLEDHRGLAIILKCQNSVKHIVRIGGIILILIGQVPRLEARHLHKYRVAATRIALILVSRQQLGAKGQNLVALVPYALQILVESHTRLLAHRGVDAVARVICGSQLLHFALCACAQ